MPARLVAWIQPPYGLTVEDERSIAFKMLRIAPSFYTSMIQLSSVCADVKAQCLLRDSKTQGQPSLCGEF